MNDLVGITTTLGATDFKELPDQIEFHSFGDAETIEEKRQALRESAKEFEAIFIHQMISAMRKTIGDSSLTKKSNGEKIFEGMLDEEWSKKLAGKTGPGSLSEILYGQLSARLGLEETEEDITTKKIPWPAPPAVVKVHEKSESL